MTFADIIRELQLRSGLGVKEYAESIGYSKTQVSNVINGQQPGSLKMAELAVKKVGLTIFDCLELPEVRQQRKINLIKADQILSRNDDYARRLSDFIEDTERRLPAATQSPPSKRRGA